MADDRAAWLPGCRLGFSGYVTEQPDPWHDEAAEGMAGGLQRREVNASEVGDASLQLPDRQPVPADLRERVEKAMREGVKNWPRDRGEAAMNVEAFHAAVSVAVRLVEEEREKVWALEINAEESDECAADLFALVCTVLDNKPEAVDARKQLQSHIDHVRACRKGSCRTELYGSRQRERAEAAEKERDEARDALFSVALNFDRWGHIGGGAMNGQIAWPTNEDIEAFKDDHLCSELLKAIDACIRWRGLMGSGESKSESAQAVLLHYREVADAMVEQIRKRLEKEAAARLAGRLEQVEIDAEAVIRGVPHVIREERDRLRREAGK